MDITSLIKIVREDYLDDTNADKPLWDNNFMLRSFTEAQRQACNRTEFNFEELSITLVNGKSSYTLDSRITKLVNIIFEGNLLVKRSIEELDYNQSDWRTLTVMTGKECNYAIRGNKIRFIPSPTVNDAGLVITIEAYTLPSDALTSTSCEPIIPEEYHRDLIWWVLYEACSKRDADSFQIKAKDYLDKFEQVFGKYVSGKVRQHQLENGLPLVNKPFNYNRNPARLSTEESW